MGWALVGILAYEFAGCFAFAFLETKVIDFRAWVDSAPVPRAVVLFFWPVIVGAYIVGWIRHDG